MTDDPTFDQRLSAAFAATSADDAPTADCPPAKEIWDAVAEELEPSRLRWLISHVASCPACTESWLLASEIAGDGASRARETTPPGATDRRLRWAGWASAVAASLGFVLFSFATDWTLTQPSIARSDGADVPVLTLIVPGQPASASECQPSWTEFEGATYDVQVLTEGLELVAERSNLTEPRFRVPEEVLGRVPAGSELRLYVAVKRGLAGVVAQSTFDLRCAR